MNIRVKTCLLEWTSRTLINPCILSIFLLRHNPADYLVSQHCHYYKFHNRASNIQSSLSTGVCGCNFLFCFFWRSCMWHSGKSSSNTQKYNNEKYGKKDKTCNPPPPMTYVIGLDASKSMTSQGWAAAVRFANGMIDYTLQDHAGKKSEVMFYYFNGLLVVWVCTGVLSLCLTWMAIVPYASLNYHSR